jgi:alpha-L-arabinofuranosidase
MVSLFPKNTWQDRPNGLRADLMDRMVAMKPGLFRFPGGSFSEGVTVTDAWKWKETLGDIAERPGNWNIWGYRSTNGLGYHEYLQMAEDLGAEPLFVAHVGMAERDMVPLNRLEPWIQDTLDAIEYANGPVTSTWGAKRAAAGHPKPFNLKYVEIGNENGMGYSWGGGTREDYLPRYRPFFERIKKLYPDIITIANAHTEPDVPAEIVDEHYYETPEWFFTAASLYDNYDRKKPKVYVGEYAAQKGDIGHGNLFAALGEAAFLTGLERNADVVLMSSYAPLFTNPQWSRWNPDAIVFDSSRVYVTPSYHVQTLFANNRPDTSLAIDRGAASDLFASVGTTKAGDLIMKLVNRSEVAEPVTIRATASMGDFAAGTATILTGPAMKTENSFKNPTAVMPTTTTIPAFTSGVTYSCLPRSVTILRWTMKK